MKPARVILLLLFVTIPGLFHPRTAGANCILLSPSITGPGILTMDSKGSFSFTVNVGVAVPGLSVDIDFTNNSVAFCPQLFGVTTSGNHAYVNTDGNGDAVFRICGACVSQEVDITAVGDGTSYCTGSIAVAPDLVKSADFDSNGFINVQDLAIFAADELKQGKPADLNGDGIVDLKDLAIWALTDADGGC